MSTMIDEETIRGYAWVTAVEQEPLDATVAVDLPANSVVIPVYDAVNFAEDGGWTLIGSSVVQYASADLDADTITLAAPFPTALKEGDKLLGWDFLRGTAYAEFVAWVQFDVDDGVDTDPARVKVNQSLADRIGPPVDNEPGAYVLLERSGLTDRWRIIDVDGDELAVDLSYGDPENVGGYSLPALDTELSNATLDLDTLNNVTLPDLDTQLTTAQGQINTLNTVTIPGLNTQLTTAQGQINTLNTTTIPNLNTQLSTAQGQIDTLNSTTIPNLNTQLGTAQGQINTLNNTTIPNLNAKFPITAANLAVTIGGGNEVYNSSFTDGVNKWLARTSTITSSTTARTYGGLSAKVVMGAGAGVDQGIAPNQNNAGDMVPVIQGQTWTISGYFLSDAAAPGNVWIGVIWRNMPAATYVGSAMSPTTVAGSTTVWLRRTLTVTVPAGCTHMQVFGCGTASTTFYIDDVQAEQGDVLTQYAPRPDELLTGQVTTTVIADGAITTAKVTVGTLNGDRVTANTLNASKIVAGSMTSDRFTANTIDGSVITANTLNASKIVAGSITTDRMTANSINGDRISASSLVTSKLVVSDMENLLDNPQARLGAPGSAAPGWTSGSAVVATATLPDGTTGPVLQMSGSGVIVDGTNRLIDVSPGDQFWYSGYVRKVSGTGTGNIQPFAPSVSLTDGNMNYGSGQMLSFNGAAASSTITVGAATMTDGQWYPFNGYLTMPALAYRYQPRVSIRSDVPDGVYQWWGLQLRRKNTGSLIVDGAIVTSHMTANTINGDRVTANTLNASKIVAGTVTSNEISVNTLTGDRILTGSLDAAKIIAGSITTDRMTANTIAGDRVTANTLDAAKIVAGSITTDRMTANTISGDRILANTLNASKIVAGTVTSNEISVNTLTGDRILTGSLNADRIVAGSITTDRMSAGSINGDRITAGTLTADRIMVGDFTNYVRDGDMQGIGTWAAQSGAPGIVSATGGPEGFATKVMRLTGDAVTAQDVREAYFPVSPGQQYQLTFWMRRNGAGTVPAAGTLTANFYTTDSASVVTTTTPLTFTAATLAASTAWGGAAGVPYTATITVPADAIQGRIGFRLTSTFTAGAIVDITRVQLRRKIAADLIVDGSTFTTNLSVASTFTLGTAAASGTIQSYGWNPATSTVGFSLAKDAFELRGGTVTGAVLQTAVAGTPGGRIVIQNDGSGGFIQFDYAQAGYNYGIIQPMWLAGPVLEISSGQYAASGTPAYIDLIGGTAASPQGNKINMIGAVDIQNPLTVHDYIDLLGNLVRGAGATINGGITLSGGPTLSGADVKISSFATGSTNNGNTGTLYVRSTTGGTLWASTTAPSSRDLKTRIRPLKVDWRKVLEIPTFSYRYKEDPTWVSRGGFMAEDTAAVGGMDLFLGYEDRKHPDKPTGFDYDGFDAALLEVDKGQQKEIDRLDGEVSELRQLVADLTATVEALTAA